MATPSEKLAQSLSALRELQQSGHTAIPFDALSRTHRERLLRHGFMQEVLRGWYIAAKPDEAAGESTGWYSAYWGFCAAYLAHRFGADWCLSPEQSLSLHVGNLTVPRQLLVRAPAAKNNLTQLPHGTSLLETRAALPEPADIEESAGLRLYTLPAALVACSPRHYSQNPTDVCAALALVRDASDMLAPLLKGGHSIVAARLSAAFRHIGQDAIADEISSAMKSAGYSLREEANNPFDASPPTALPQREASPYVNRVRLMWQAMRQPVIDNFPASGGRTQDSEGYLAAIEDAYTADAYHSLSIEGYQVSPELIERVRSGRWNPSSSAADMQDRNALAARGYWQAFQAVKADISEVLAGKNPGAVAQKGHRTWYRELFSPSVAAGIIQAADLAGYRSSNVYIRQSMHTPPAAEAVRDAMPAFFDLLAQEENPAARVVLGHFVFVYIHPYMDGNGRIGRFLMNTMLAAGGYPWTIVPVQRRQEYMRALEEASVNGQILPFTRLLASLLP